MNSDEEALGAPRALSGSIILAVGIALSTTDAFTGACEKLNKKCIT